MNQIIEKLKDKNIAILGFGKEGKSTYNFIRRYLNDKLITILDKNPVVVDDSNVLLVTGDNYLDNLDKYDLIIKSPGISLKDLDISNIKNKITSQLELILEEFSDNIIGITGTKGKSTTTTLIYEVIKKQRDNVFLLGNIGIPLLDQYEEYNKDSILVIEMSSHQLEFVRKSPHIAIILNLFQDHLDHSGTLEHYHQNKMNIFKYQNSNDYALYSSDNYYLEKLVNSDTCHGMLYDVRFDNSEGGSRSLRINDGKIYLGGELLYTDSKREIIGDHNLKNIMFVVGVCKILGLNLDIAHDSIVTTKGLKYRMEKIGTFNEITYYNDTIATIPDATISAIEAIGNVDSLIFGGLDRGIDYSGFIDYLKSCNVSNLICMPTTGTNIGKLLKDNTDKNIIFVDTLEEAYHECVKYTKKGSSVLLSPAAASYEFFKNFEEKGAAFEKIVLDNNK